MKNKLKNKLKEIREKKNLTQEELSDMSGVSRITISGIESGRMSVAKTDTLVKLADALGMSVVDVFFCE